MSAQNPDSDLSYIGDRSGGPRRTSWP